MKKLGLLTMVLGIVGVLGVVKVRDALAKDGDCHRTTFQTELVKNACAKGGQKAAKDAMKAFLKDNKPKMAGLDCTTCHAKLAPNYELKPDATKTFTTLGGKLISAGQKAPGALKAPPPAGAPGGAKTP